MLVVIDITGVVDQQRGNSVIDPVGPAQAWVVHLLVADDQQGTVILWAGQQGQQQGTQSGFV